MGEYLQHLGQRTAIWSMNPYVQDPQSRNEKTADTSQENPTASQWLHELLCIWTGTLKLPGGIFQFKGSVLRDPECYCSIVKGPWQQISGGTKGHLTSKESNPEMEGQRLRALRTLGWGKIPTWLQMKVPPNNLQVLVMRISTSATSAELCQALAIGTSGPHLEEHVKMKNPWNCDMLEAQVGFWVMLDAFISLSGRAFRRGKFRIVLYLIAMQIYISSIWPTSSTWSPQRRNSILLRIGVLEEWRQKSRGAPLAGVISTA